jgi:DNA polymerase III subunit beta
MSRAITVPTKGLRRALANAARIAPSKPSNPIMGCVKLEFGPDRIMVSATSGSSDWFEQVPADCDSDAQPLYLAAGLLSQIVANLPGDLTVLEVDGAGLKISSGGSRASLAATSADGAPELFGQGLEFAWTVDAGDLLSAIQSTRYATAKPDDGRGPILKGIQFELGERAACVATDGFRLARAPVTMTGAVEAKASVSDTMGCLGAIELLLKSSSGPVQIGRGMSTLALKTDTMRLHVGLLEGELPAWGRLVPASFPTSVEVSRLELLEAVRRVGLFANQNPANRMHLSVEDRALYVRGVSQIGEQTESVEAVLTGEPCAMDFNCVFFTQTLEAAPGDRIVLKPGVKKPLTLESGEWFGLLMPVMD